MGSYGHLLISGRELLSFRHGVEPTFMLLFRRSELRRVPRLGADRPRSGYAPDDRFVAIEFAMSSVALRERLAVLGMGRARLAAAFDEMLRSRVASDDGYLARFSTEVREAFKDEAAALQSLTLDRWQQEVKAAVEQGDDPFYRRDVGSLGWLLGLWDYADPRYPLLAVAEAFPDSEVVLDVTDLEEGGWFDSNEDPRELALSHFGAELVNGAAVIILTEGSSDVAVLSAALRILYPHLDGFIHFADFSYGAEGGAASLVRLVRSLAAAGIANRVVAVFDNDTASSDALRSLDRRALPHNISILQLPPIDIARYYPTLGPTGLVEMDVNGVGASIELYLGRETLAGDDGARTPVQWMGYVPRLRRYQGEVLDKTAIHARFRSKVRRAEESGGTLPDQDWSGLRLIFETLLQLLQRVP